MKMKISAIVGTIVPLFATACLLAAAAPSALGDAKLLQLNGGGCGCLTNSPSSDCTVKECGNKHNCTGTNGTRTCADRTYCNSGAGCDETTAEPLNDCQT